MLFLSERGAAGAGPSGWTRIAPWMRTTGDTGKGSSGKSEWRQCPVFHLTPKHHRAGTSVAVSSLPAPSPSSTPEGCWTRGCRRTAVLGGPALGGT